MKFSWVGQKDPDKGCGIAATAMIAGVKYKKAHRAFEKKHRKSELVGPSGIRKALTNLDSRLCMASTRREFEGSNKRVRKYLSKRYEYALIATKRKKGCPYHWLIWLGKENRFLDPSEQSNPNAKSWKLERVYHLAKKSEV